MRGFGLDKDARLRRFPTRTLLLMILALIVFVRFWCQTHPRLDNPKPVDVRISILFSTTVQP